MQPYAQQRTEVVKGLDGRGIELEPITVLPCQYADRTFTAHLRPEGRLQLAVLEDAVLTLHRCAGRTGMRARRLLGEVEAWVTSDDASWPFAFVNICETLGLDPAYIRSGLTGWRKRDRAGRTPPLWRNRCGARHHVVPPRFGGGPDPDQ